MNVDDNCADTRFVQQHCPGCGAYWQKWQKWTTINFAEERKKRSVSEDKQNDAFVT